MHDAVAALAAEARQTNERRLLVLAGSAAATASAVPKALDAANIAESEAVVVGERDLLDCERVTHDRAGDLLGTTHEAVVYDAHDTLDPNSLGRVVGAVDGGGLLVLVTPPLDDWSAQPDGFTETLAVPPFAESAVTGHLRERLVRTLREHRGVAIVDADAGTVLDDGLTHPAPRIVASDPDPPTDHRFPVAAYDACLTDDQVDTVHALEGLLDDEAAVVEADRGRGKSSAAGLAAGSLALAGRDVLVTAPGYRNAAAVFERARALIEHAGALVEMDDERTPQRLATADGQVRFSRAPDAADLPGDPDVVVVDEAAALPVRLLAEFLDAPAVAFTTTVHGYEGTGRGFAVRFRDHLAAARETVTEVTMADPIRYAPGDPIEVWAFRALMLDARPPVDPLVADAGPETVKYERLTTESLLGDEHQLRESFGLLVLAHYRTEPADLARLLDAPNLHARALTHDGHVVAVALLAREGNLDSGLRGEMYDGARVRGNMLPDVLTTQLRDERAGIPEGLRVVRIATHNAARERGLGSRLLEEVRAEFDVDYLGVGYGATPGLLSFWQRNGFGTVHLSTTRNDTSGEYSAIMLDPLTDAGRDLRDRHAERFLGRAGSMLADPLADADPDVVRAALASVPAAPTADLAPWEWEHVAGAAYGPGLFDTAPEPFRRLAVVALADASGLLDDRLERLLVTKVLQTRSWDSVADHLDYPSARQAKRALGEAYRPLVDRYGDDRAREVRGRYA